MTRSGSARLKRTYGSREVAAITGLSARQLQLWESGGLMLPVMPSRRTAAGGFTERRYSPIDVLDLIVLAELRRAGFSIQQLHTIVRGLKEQFNARLFDATGGGGGVDLVSDGERVYVRTRNGEFFNALESPAQPLLVVANERSLKVLGGRVRRRRPKRRRAKRQGVS